MIKEKESKKMGISPLQNMLPIGSDSIKKEFEYVCEFVSKAIEYSHIDKKGCSYFTKGLDEVLRCFGLKFRPSRISKKALNSEHWRNIENDFSSNSFLNKWYNNKKKYYPLFLEHIVPIGSLLKRCQECDSIEKVKTILSELEFVIILECENDKIRKKGYRTKGRETLEKAEDVYKNICEIELSKIPYT